jgi:hypothetical protein
MVDEQIADRHGSLGAGIESRSIIRQIKVSAHYLKAIAATGRRSIYADHLLSPFEMMGQGNTPG